MTDTTMHSAGPPATGAAAGVGAFMLTLCRLDAPVSIRPPQTPQLARFKFFMSRARRADGNESLYLHMGYFSTLEDAKKCAQIMRARYPEAIATRTPQGLLPRAEPPVLQGIPPAEAGALTDTQVLDILATRRVQLSELGKQPAPERPEISLLRPDDTNTRRALKEAVVRGAPISFVVQLCQADEPIKPGSIPALDIFRAYTLYLAAGDYNGRPWHALRLGFFNDADSAKQVASYARTSFTTVAVVPINEGERTRASKNPISLTRLAKPAHANIDEVLAADQASSAAAETNRRPAPGKPFSAPSPPPGSAQNRAIATPKSRPKDSLEQTLEMLTTSELWSNTDSDSMTSTGVRHLKVEVQKRVR